MLWIVRSAALSCAAFFLGCASTPALQIAGVEDPEISAAVDRNAAPEGIAYCHGYGCGVTHLVKLSAHEWNAIRGLLQPPSASAAQERRAIATAVALFEQAAARQAGTGGDKPGTPFSMGDPTQLDCVDESINTSSFLHLLARGKLLHWHDVGEPARRYAFLMLGVHFTAVVTERADNARYAVDSWFHANGEPPEVVALPLWRAGWKPGLPQVHMR